MESTIAGCTRLGRRRTRYQIVTAILQFVSVILAGLLLLMGGTSAAAQQTATASTRQQRGPQVSVDARELPADEYARLKAVAMAGSRSRFGPRIRNPKIASDGLAGVEVSILDEQQAYLRRSHERGIPAQAVFRQASSLWMTGVLGSCPTPIVASVNGRVTNAVFTPRLGDNHFRIEGCGFGAEPGEVFLQANFDAVTTGIPARPIILQVEGIEGWSETAIDVRLDPRLSGVFDSDVKLVVRRANGYEGEFAGCRFIAARGEPTRLKTIAGSWVKLTLTTTSSRPIRELEYLSPPVGAKDVPRDAPRTSALVARADSEPFAAASDTYDFSFLNPGWAVDSIQLESYSPTCPGDVTRSEQAGSWNASFDAYGFTIAWASTACSSFIPPTFRFSLSSSLYAVKVWVVGPVGTEPVRADVHQDASHN